MLIFASKWFLDHVFFYFFDTRRVGWIGFGKYGKFFEGFPIKGRVLKNNCKTLKLNNKHIILIFLSTTFLHSS